MHPEYGSRSPEISRRLDGLKVAAVRQACIDHHIWGSLAIMESNPNGNPTSPRLIIDNDGEIKLYDRIFYPESRSSRGTGRSPIRVFGKAMAPE